MANKSTKELIFELEEAKKKRSHYHVEYMLWDLETRRLIKEIDKRKNKHNC